MKHRIFIATSSFLDLNNDPTDLLKKNSIDYFFNEKGRTLTENEILNYLTDCDGVIAGTEKYNTNLLEKLTKLKVISRLGVGTDNIDLGKAESEGIKVISCKTSPIESVSEIIIAALIMLSRNITPMMNSLKDKKWEKRMGNLISNRNLGIVGLGKIGKKLVQQSKGFGLSYYAYDENQDEEFAKKFEVKYVSLEKLFEKSDFISLNIPLTHKTENILNRDAFLKMKRKPIIVNTSRGELIDEDDLGEALKSGQISSVFLDVFRDEPFKSDKLLELDNFYGTPHIGAYAEETRSMLELEAVENLIREIKN